MSLNDIINQIESQVDIADVIRSYIPLKASGRNFKALCPFHSEKTPSFMVSPSKGIWHCFGCEKGGNVINFVKEFEQVSFWEAIKIIAEKYHISIPQLKGAKGLRDEVDTEKEDLYRVLDFAAEFFRKNLSDNLISKRVWSYLEKRKLDKAVVNKFGLGYATSKSDGLLKKANAGGFTTNLLRKAGLVTGDDTRKSYQDMFFNKLIFPIFNSMGKIVGFAGRVLDNSTPKYINSPETKVYRKGSLLYGFHLAKESIRKNKYIIIVEGYMDVIVCHQYGFKNVVAAMGTALTQSQARFIKKWCKEALLLYDSDNAGMMAASRNGQVLENEGLTVKVVKLPKGEDPDSYLKKFGAVNLTKLIEKSKVFFTYFLDYAIEKYGKDTADGKVSIVKDVLPIICEINNEVKRSFFIKEVAESIDIPELALISEMKKVRKNVTSTTETKTDMEKKTKYVIPQAEKVLINLLLDNTDLIEQTKSLLNNNWISSAYSKKVIDYLFSVDSDKFCDILNLLENYLLEDEFKVLRELILGLEFENKIQIIWRDCLCAMRNSFLEREKSKLIKQIKDAKSSNEQKKADELVCELQELTRELINPFLN